MEDTPIQIDGHNAHNGKQEFTTHNGKEEAFIPHAREQMTMITCSPNMQNIVTWSDVDKSAICWCVSDNQQKLELKHKISLENNKKYKNYVDWKYITRSHSKNFGGIKNYFTVSDDKFVSMPISEEKDEVKVVIKDYDEYIKRIKVGIFKFETGKNVSLKLPHSEMIVETLAFLNENKLIMIRSITKWDINTLKFEAYFLFDNSFDVDNMKLSDNGVLLFVYGRKRDNWHKNPYSCISIYSADHGNKFTTYKYEDKPVIIDAVYLIASDIGARLLTVHHKTFMKKNEEEKEYQYYICDPFAPYISNENYVKANDLFRDFEAKSGEIFENKYIIKNDKIVGFNHDGKLVIGRLIANNWITYLRETLKDFNRIFISSVSEKIIDLIVKNNNTIEKSTTDGYKKYPKKYFVTWTLKEVKNLLDICDCLDNDDLAMVAYWGVVNEIIKLFYETDKENFDEKNFDIKKLKKKSYFLPTSSYINMIRYNPAFSQSNLQPPEDDRFLFNELIKKHINNKYFLILYGKKLIEDIIKENEETLLRKLLNRCIKQIEEDEEIPNPLIFNIFLNQSLKYLKKNPSFFDVLLQKFHFYAFLSFIIVATLSKFISWPCQMILLIITAVLGFWHLFFEICNFTFSHKEYFESLWNYLDLGAIISAIVTSIIWLINGSVSTGAITFTTLLLELKFIIYLRFIRCFGIYLAMIMNTADKVVAFLILFGLIILAFAHSLHLLLRSEIFQDSGVNMFTIWFCNSCSILYDGYWEFNSCFRMGFK
ncbi:nudt9 protein [Gigaspora margarita]|uniref:Nudt9 protein n=1 Tax=Gigaspora margarita TaxID=4874 RepID=A0A8H3X887_GIGMA|nr:nudt9 protein [Gigaspora margarita]